MNLITKFWRRLRSLAGRPTVKNEIDEELRFHIEKRAADNVADGLSPGEADRAARKSFGNLQTVREQCREKTGASFGEDTVQDLRLGLRMLRKNPGFSAVAVLTLALGIGANTAIFSVVNSVLLRPLPYRQPGQIVMLWADNPSFNVGFHEMPAAPPDLLDWRKRAKSFDEIAGIRPRTADLSDAGDPERTGGSQVTENFFTLLGVQPAFGRAFAAEEMQPGHDNVAIISYGLWQRRFGGDSNVIGRTITVNRERRTIVGVMPPSFNFPRGTEMPALYGFAPRTEVWTPFAGSAEYWANQDTRDYITVGRMKPGITLAQAQAEMTMIAANEAKEQAATHVGWTVRLRPLTVQITGPARPILLALMGAVGFVLLIACVNVSNLLLSRSAARGREMAVRAAVGARRSRLIRQLLGESAVLSILGGAGGLLLGAGAVRLILLLSPPNIPRLNETSLDIRVFCFALLISLITTVVFGLAPAWHASNVNLFDALRSDTRSSASAGSRRAHGLLIVSEVALAVVLLAGASLMAKSFLRLQAVDPGFQPQHVASFDVGLFGDKYDQPKARAFFRNACERLAALPGIRSAAAISNLPLGGSENMNHMTIEGVPLPPGGEEPVTENRRVTPGYFQTMGVKMIKGRDFGSLDGPDRQRVCVINQTIARDHFPGVDPIGKRLKLGRHIDNEAWLTIVGIVGDVRGYALDVEPKPQVYSPLDQDTQNEMTMVVRGDTPAASLEGAIRAEMKSIDPGVPVANFRMMQSLVSDSVARPRFSAFLFAAFAAIALVLTAVGLYGVVAYATAQRSREIGIRMALGATPWNVLRLVLRQGMLPAVTGLCAGIAGSFALTRFLSSQLYEVRATDPLTFLLAAAVIVLAALAACYIPARRAAKVDPVIALRYE